MKVGNKLNYWEARLGLAAGIWEPTRIGGRNLETDQGWTTIVWPRQSTDKSTISFFSKPINHNDDLKYKLTKELGNLGVELNL